MLKFFPNKYEIVALMSEKSDGSMRVFESGINDENRRNFFGKNNIDKNKIISAEIIHSSCAKVVDKNSPKIIKGVDALVSKEKIFIAVTVADCIPVYFYDEKNKVIGVAHAGWRGITRGIIKNTLEKMGELGAEMGHILVAMGLGLRVCHFEIGEDVLDNFIKYPEFVIRENGKIFVNLFEIIKKELLSAGVLEKNIFDSGECTFCNEEKYFSYRRDKPEKIEAMIAVIGLR
jgi:YfiH family protein